MSRHTPGDLAHWKGRSEPDSTRLFQIIDVRNPARQAQPESAANSNPAHTRSPGVQILGYSCDEGVRRNRGRVGAAAGPLELRRYLGSTPLESSWNPVFDAGDVSCVEDDLEGCQAELARRVTTGLAHSEVSCVLGGGHDVAYAHYLGLAPHLKPGDRLGCINFDAHFDLRDRVEGRGHSGSPFLQMLEHARGVGGAQPADFEVSYFCLGVQPLGNHSQLFQRAQELHCEWVEAQDLATQETTTRLARFLRRVDVLYVTVCLDVFQQAIAPGVSAPQPLGIDVVTFLKIFRQVLDSGKVTALDVAELNPHFDLDGRTAKLGAAVLGTAFQHAHFWSQSAHSRRLRGEVS